MDPPCPGCPVMLDSNPFHQEVVVEDEFLLVEIVTRGDVLDEDVDGFASHVRNRHHGTRHFRGKDVQGPCGMDAGEPELVSVIDSVHYEISHDLFGKIMCCKEEAVDIRHFIQKPVHLVLDIFYVCIPVDFNTQSVL